jgi:hypothetical protein
VLKGGLLEWGKSAGLVAKVRAGEGNCWSWEEMLERQKKCVLEGETSRVGKKCWNGSKSACWRGKLL